MKKSKKKIENKTKKKTNEKKILRLKGEYTIYDIRYETKKYCWTSKRSSKVHCNNNNHDNDKK
jgi:hypothetical protein